MAAVMQSYFVYMPDNRLCAAWGCTAISTGYTEIGSNSDYPPSRHPNDHHFSWSRGRILSAYQIVQISAGSGRLEFGPSRRQVAIAGGSIFLLFPGVWHRFAPDRRAGWVEHWIECRGSAFDFACDAGLLRPEQPVHASSSEIADVFASIHALAQDDCLRNQPLLSTLGLQLLALLCRPADLNSNAADRLVDRARMILMERCGQPLSVEQLADELGVSYPYFRRLFREQTGMSAKQYQMRVRLQRAIDLLVNTDKSIKEIAGLLGFHSAFHFSTQFRQLIGSSPTDFRAAKRS
ncbi:helix-turn-helix domain-containing protein [Rhizobium brockwellii]|uniref:AraC family transcriptional regulator n=2 Tax=Rhizobium TaxID=379 RepID=A0ABU3YQU3_9HYPH|nr:MULTISPECIES: AraC family transcriptional regulator [Rhizobium]MDV4155668.1 AraC family transcriptional regulator [Rhizobium brockwellii]MDV4182382.1 AraC family transcriptional regulator [Rhizobium brockwellii]MDV4188209.1 AraC family transcriptional regulator [Rhizobium brockwellii]